MTDTKKKANPDYSSSAVNLTNPPDALNYLKNLHSFRAELDDILTAIENSIPHELRVRRDVLEKDIENLIGGIKIVIDNQGSYQDTALGLYALKQRRESIIYRPEAVRVILDKKLADLVIVEAVDSKALDGLVKGGLVSPEKARECGEVKETYAYIIK